ARVHRLWYMGAMFRYARPQKGRYRQFWQIGAEVIGTPAPAADVEIIALFVDVFEVWGFANLGVALNSVGTPATRRIYGEALRAWFEPVREKLSAERAGRRRSLQRTDRGAGRAADARRRLLDRARSRDPGARAARRRGAGGGGGRVRGGDGGHARRGGGAHAAAAPRVRGHDRPGRQGIRGADEGGGQERRPAAGAGRRGRVAPRRGGGEESGERRSGNDRHGGVAGDAACAAGQRAQPDHRLIASGPPRRPDTRGTR